ncbi:trypsin-like serine protease [Candidatus Bathyarchaeota archaeon]|nr:MAG: trypsin-like serine protease [Candidatus Bathyarchaeota archaeon]
MTLSGCFEKLFISVSEQVSGEFGLSDEWFFESSGRRKPSRSWLPLLFVALIVVNAAVVVYYTNEMNRNVSELNAEIETLQFQLNSVNYEIATLRDTIIIQKQNYSRDLELTQIYNQTRRSVVLIEVRTSTGGGQGSGFVYDSEGRIITNHHVVEDAVSGGITVTFIDGTIVDAELVGTDAYVDLAVIDVDVPSYLLQPVKLGSSEDLLVGEQVIALGNPFGLADTMTAGIVSATGRQMNAPGDYVIVDVIQTDAAINFGNSGGPLLNMEGKVVGMNTAILSETGQFSGIGFAIPSDTIAREVPFIIAEGEYKHPYMGIRGMGLIPEIKEHMGLDDSVKGALVSEVEEGGPADVAGVRGGERDVDLDGFTVRVGGDIIIGVDGQTVNDFYELVVNLERYHMPGDVVTLTILRDNSVIELDLELGVRPDP